MSTMRLSENEFGLAAKLKTSAVVTARRRSRKLVHFSDSAAAIWRRPAKSGEMPLLARITATTLCGTSIHFAEPSPPRDDEVWCEPCCRVAHRELLQDDQFGVYF